jgi:hypothetical protein
LKAPYKPDYKAYSVTVASEYGLLFGEELGKEGEPAIAKPALVQRFLELGLASKLCYLGSIRGGLDEGGEVAPLAWGETSDVLQFALRLPLEQPHAPGKGDEDAAWLGAGNLAIPPIYL